jgi:hypothetical protein
VTLDEKQNASWQAHSINRSNGNELMSLTQVHLEKIVGNTIWKVTHNKSQISLCGKIIWIPEQKNCIFNLSHLDAKLTIQPYGADLNFNMKFLRLLEEFINLLFCHNYKRFLWIFWELKWGLKREK